jgi:N utilization substance protein B
MLVKGVLTEKEELDHRIESASEHWSIARMPVIDRSILRLGLYELMHNTETPTAVIVSEAVRLAKTYSTERSGAFVNGVLASLARSVRG